jgi:uncharacterized RDD family membrane protein YckC
MTITEEPFASAMPSVGAGSRPRAGFWRRFAAYVLDAISINIYSLPLLFFGSEVYSAGFVLMHAAYYTCMEGGQNGRTVGKMALGIMVSDVGGGGPIGYRRAFIRWAGRLLSAVVFLLGYLWMLWDKENQTWHDKMAASVVVPAGN